MSKVEFLFLSEEDLVEAGVLDAKKMRRHNRRSVPFTW